MGLFWDSYKGAYGSAEYMGIFERSVYLSRFHKGLIVGNHSRLSLQDSYMNLAILGATGAGKSSKIYIPNLLKLQDVCAVVADTSGEMYEKTSKYLSKKNFEIFCFNPLSPSKSLCFNPLKYQKSSKDRKQFAQFIVEQRAEGQFDTFWDTQAVTIINIVFHVLEKNFPENEVHLSHAGKLIDGLNQEEERKQFEKLVCDPKTDTLIFQKWKSFREQEEKVFLGALSTASASLDYWTEEEIAEVTSKDSFDLSKFRDQKRVLYIMASEDDVEYYKPLLNTFYTALFRSTLKGKIVQGKKDIFFLLDEFGNLGKIHNFPAIITTSRKKRASFCLALQDRFQLDGIYGREGANAIYYGGVMNKLYLGGLSNPQTLRELQELLGTRTVIDQPRQGSERNVAQQLETVSELRMIPDDRAVLISKNRKPCWLKCEGYFRRWGRAFKMDHSDIYTKN